MKYYITAERFDLDGFPQGFTVGYDNKDTCDFDNFMFFDTKEEAEQWTQSAQAKEWKDCTFSIVEVGVDDDDE